MRFEILQRKKEGKYYFCLKSDNGWTLLTSQPYENEDRATDGVKSLRRNSGIDDKYEGKIAKNGRHYFNVLNENNTVLATSRLYKRKKYMNRVIRKVKEGAPTAELEGSKPTVIFTPKKGSKLDV